MRVLFHGLGPSLNIDHPGDLHFANCLHRLETKAPRCAGVVSGEAEISVVMIDVEAPEYGLRGLVDFERIHCPESCPRDEKSIRERCLIS